MSLRVGLGASQADLDIQGEIDFDFFAESDSVSSTSILNATRTKSTSPPSTRDASQSPADSPRRGDSDRHPPLDLNVTKVLEPARFTKPVITVSCDDLTGRVQKTSIEAVIPTPFNFLENKSRKGSKKMMSPKLKTKAFNLQELDVSDDSSISSMSGSESDLSATDDSSVDLNNDSDSMTDVTPLMSPYQCYSPMPGASSKRNTSREESPLAAPPKDRVKFTDNDRLQGENDSLRCQSVDINELLKAVKRLEVGQEAPSVPKPKSASPSVITQNMRCKKNLSFSNDEVRRIDNDNHVLLKKINAQKNRSRAQPSVPVRVVSSASVNRQRNQRSIELENMAILKRLESTKASKEMRRSFLLKEYESRSAGVLSRASSRASKTNSERASVVSSGRNSAASTKSGNSSASLARTAKP